MLNTHCVIWGAGRDVTLDLADLASCLKPSMQVNGHDHEVKYAHLDHSGPRMILASSLHDMVNYATIQPEQ